MYTNHQEHKRSYWGFIHNVHDKLFGQDRTWIGEIRKLAQSEANKN